MEEMSTEDLVAELRRREESGRGRRKAPWKRRIIQAAVGAVCTAITAGGGWFVQQFFETTDNQQQISVNQQAQMQAVWSAITKLRDSQVSTLKDVTKCSTDVEWIIRLATMEGDLNPSERPQIDEEEFEDASSVLELPIDEEEPPAPPEPVMDPLLSSEPHPPRPRVRKRAAKAYKPSKRELVEAQEVLQQLLK
jgi:hypothetical protein